LHKEKTDDETNGIVSNEQKGFLRGIQSCTDHIAEIKFLLANAKGKKKTNLVGTLDCKEAFGSVTYEILDQNLTKLGIQECFKDVIKYSYIYAFIRIWDTDEASNLIHIIKGLKQGCKLNPLLFDIYFDPIFAFIKREVNHKFAYSTEEFPINLIRAYADDVILISNSADSLQSLINEADNFFTLLNIKLSPNNAKRFKLTTRKKKKS
jgi:hypothetical protein